MSPHTLRLDFAGRRRTPKAGYVLVLSGLIALTAALYFEEESAGIRDTLQMRLDTMTHRRGGQDPATDRMAKEGERVLAALQTPWSKLLQELELASRDTREQVAVLAIEPDHAKHRIRVVGEAKNLADALAYVERLQHSHVLRSPMLVSHQTRSDDAERPVRFQLSADWKDES